MDIGDQHLRCSRGDDLPVRLAMVPPVDVAGWELAFTVKRRPDDAAALIRKTTEQGIALVDEETGVWDIDLDGKDTNNTAVGAGLYVFDVRRTDAGNERVIARGTLNVLEAVGLPSPQAIEASDDGTLEDDGEAAEL